MDKIELKINGRAHSLEVHENQSLLNVLRDELDLTGTKYGCGEGQCGACTVLVEGTPMRSCVTPAASVQGHEITTIEGLERDGQLHPMQQAFLDEDALQCGYCTPGMILSAIALVNNNDNPSEAEIVDAMQGNICRCGTYSRIVAAIQRAAHNTKEGVR